MVTKKKTARRKADIGKQVERELKRETRKSSCSSKCCMDKMCSRGGFYFLGFIGALVYYIATAPSFWMGVWGVIKAILWPAFLVYGLMKSIGL